MKTSKYKSVCERGWKYQHRQAFCSIGFSNGGRAGLICRPLRNTSKGLLKIHHDSTLKSGAYISLYLHLFFIDTNR